MKKFIQGFFASLLLYAGMASAQPGPVPSPWLVNGNSISYGGCILTPVTVTGGCKGNGTINAAGLYVNGVNAFAIQSVFGRTGTITSQFGDYAFTQISGTLGVSQGGTGLSAGSQGGIPWFSGTQAISSSAILAQNQIMLGGGTGSAPATLGSLGTAATLLHGNASGAPSFSAVVLTTDVSGILPVTNGGIGIASGTSGGIPYFSASSTIATSAVLTANQLVIGGGAGVAPAALGSLGTTTTILHGNASGLPTFGAVVLTTDVSGILPTANGGTANAFFTVSGPSASAKTFSFPNASATVLTDNAVVTGAQGGTGVANTGKTITIGGSINTAAAFSTTGAGATTLAFGASTQTYTFPTTTATLARTDAGQTFTGTNTFGALNTGAIEMGGSNITGANTISGAAATNLILNTASATGGFLEVAGTPIAAWNAGAFYPGTTNSFGLGATTNRWSTVYSVAGNFSGAVTGLSGVFNNGDNTSLAIVGLTKGIRMSPGSAGSTIEGVDSTLVGSYQPLILGGSTVSITNSGSTVATFGSGAIAINGSSSGIISLKTQAAAGTYNWNWPTTAGTAGQVLASGGGGSTAMTWADVLSSVSPTFSGTVTMPDSTTWNSSGVSKLVLTGSTTAQLSTVSSAISMDRISSVTAVGTTVTADALRFLNPAGTVVGTAGLSGVVSMSCVDTGNSANVLSQTYSINTTGNGTSNISLLQIAQAVRGTNPLSNFLLATDGGGVKLQITTNTAGVSGATCILHFNGVAL